MAEMDKDSLRREARRYRDSLDLNAQDVDSACGHFLQAFPPRAGQAIAAYWAKGREFNPWPIVEACRAGGADVLLPIVLPETRTLAFGLWQEDSDLEQGAFGLMQPRTLSARQPDIVLVPLLAFDRRGHRLGYGGGYYDSTLRALRAQGTVVAAGLAYASQACLFPLPTESHDEKLDWIVTPQGAMQIDESLDRLSP